VEVEWRVQEDQAITLRCVCPPNCRTLVRLYRREGETQVLVDGARQAARPDGVFVEIQIPPGRHTIEL